jgi:hypothetical protein
MDPSESVDDFFAKYKPPAPGEVQGQQAPQPTTDEQSAEVGELSGATIAPAVFTPPKPVAQKQETVDDFFARFKPQAPVAPPPPPSFGEIYAAASGAKPEDWYKGAQATPIGRIVDAFSGGAKGAYADPLGFSPETTKALQSNLLGGDFNPIPGQKAASKAIFDGVVAPAAVLADAAYRALPAIINGTANAAYQAGQEGGQQFIPLPEGAPEWLKELNSPEELGKAVAGYSEYAMQRGDVVGTGIPKTPAEIAKHAEAAQPSTILSRIDARDQLSAETLALQAKTRIELSAQTHEASKDFGATGTEGDYFGTEKTDPLVMNPGNSLPGDREGVSFVGALEPETAQPETDVHKVARSVAPEVFEGPNGYDALSQRKDTFNRWLTDLGQARDETATADIDKQIEDTQTRLEDATGKRAATYRNRLTDLQDQREQASETATSDTPDMARIRAELQKTDYQIRDLAPQVSAAYREAESRVPKTEEPIAEPAKAPEKVGVVEEPAAEPKTEPAAEPAGAAQPVEEAPKPKFVPAIDIAQDVSQKLSAAGRPAEESQAAAALIASHYEARAANLKGATAEQLYRDEAPEIKAGRGVRSVEYAQKAGKTLDQKARARITVSDARNTITLLKDANASSFIHETGHQWLEELTRDAADPRATDAVRTDTKTVRDWLGNDGGEITRAQHEKFARGFERYMMEGRAPSQALADVFAKFKAWLTNIYETVAKLRAPINDDIRDVFDRLITKTPGKAVIAPDREASSLADRHEALGEAVKPGQEHPTANLIENEAEAHAGRRIPETHDAVIGAVESGSGEGGAEGPPPDRGSLETESDTRGAVARPGVGAIGEGGGEASPASLGASPKEVGRKVIYERVPREPQRLLGFLRSLGGIKDDSGEFKSVVGEKGSFGGLVNRKSGISLEEAAKRAQEEGFLEPDATIDPNTKAEYLKGGSGVSKLTGQDLLDALSEDISGNARYSAKDATKAAAFREATGRNEELEHLATQHGLEINAMTREEFFAKLYDRMSQDKAASLAEEKEHATGEDLAAAERQAQEEAESRGDAWEPEADNTRSLEDLENERQSEETARNAGQGANADEQPRPIAGNPSLGEEGGGQRGNSLGAGHGTNGEGSRNAARSDGDDLAGNIKLRNLLFKRLGSVVDEGDVRALVKQIAAENSDLNDARFGEAAYQLQRQVLASGEILETTSIAATEALAKWKASGSEDHALAYKFASDRVLLAANVRAELAAGIGRGLAAFRKIEERGEAESIVDYIKRTTGKTLFQLQEEGDLFDALETPDQQASFLNRMRAKPWATSKSIILSYFINNLISGPITHASYSIGNTFWSMFKAGATTSVAAAIDSAREAIRGERIPDRVYFKEVTAQMAAMWRGGRDSIPAAWKAVQTGVPFMQGLEEMAKRSGQEMPSHGARPQVIPGKIGHYLEFPSRAVTGIHTVFYAVNYEAEIARRAWRSGLAKDLFGDDLQTHVANYIANPPDKAVAEAHDEALKMVLMKRPPFDSFMANIQRGVNNNFAAKIVMPFMQIGSNILREGIVEHSPVGILSSAVRENLSGRNGDVARSTQYAKIAVGTFVATTVIGATAEGIITGGGPSDPNERHLKEMTGWKPYAIKIGDEFIPFRKFLGPMGPLMAAAADMYEIGHAAATDGFAKAGTSLILGLSEVVFDETWMSGLSNFLNAVKNYDRDGGKYVRSLATDFIPFSVGMSQVARLIDPEVRRVNSFTDAVKSKIPFLSESLLPMRDLWGDPMASHMMTSPSAVVDDPATNALEKVGLFPAQPQGMINGIKLSPKQYDDYTRIAGRQAHLRIMAMVNTPGFEAQVAMNPAAVKRAFQEIIKAERVSARRQVLMQSDAEDGAESIRIQSTAAKMKKLYGAYQ